MCQLQEVQACSRCWTAKPQEAVIKVVGVGGCGGNAVDHMIDRGRAGRGVHLANTDAQALKRNQAPIQLQLGARHHQGSGRGRQSRDRARGRDRGSRAHRRADRRRRHAVPHRRHGRRHRHWRGADRGGSGEGAGILTVAVVTKPFAFEGKRQTIARQGSRRCPSTSTRSSSSPTTS